MKEFIVGKNDAGQRLDRFTSKAAPLLPSSLLQKYIRIKRIKVGGKGAARSYTLVFGDVVQMYVNDEFFQAPNEENAYLKITNPELDIIYEDENIILINKPAGVLCHSDGTESHSTIVMLKAYLYQNKQWRAGAENAFAPALCNRIDRNTTGIVIAAKNAEAMRVVNEKIKLHEIDKYYLSIVHGRPNPACATLKGFIFKDAVKNQVYVSKSSRIGSKSAIMEYRTITSNDTLSLLECKLITGRTHQIRAQLADIGHPLLGDGKYGSERLNKLYRETRQALCSYKLEFRFKSVSGVLSYLDNKVFQIHNIPFIKKYFPTIDF
ncbi:MAG: RluA family pseudouridine synthase [Oscillospiraceae bacterium]|nr:RluA family pseudouridine synthase [Oscillospiraceae bacterium]